LDTADYESLRYLQKQRHLSAHPVLNNKRELHAPNKETVRSLLRNTLECLLIKPPFYTKKILDEILEDIAENKDSLNTHDKVKRYLESRYLSRLTKEVELQIFKSLWKLVFNLSNEICDKNRSINLKTIHVINKRIFNLLPQEIEGDKDYFSNIASNGLPLSALIIYLAQNHKLYSLLNEDAQIKIQHEINTTNTCKFIGWFVKGDLESHMAFLINWIKSDEYPSFSEANWGFLLKISDTEEWENSFCNIISTYYVKSLNYNDADSRFGIAIEPYLYLFNTERIKSLLFKIEGNCQVYERSRAYIDHPKIKTRALELDDKFDFTNFERFSNTVDDDF
jgi:hypothetical protein